VLIIEDEPFFAMDLQSVLELVGASSFAFADTHKEAVAAALAQKPAVITSDVMLL
jgi:CheY-like chemotaxis protein